MNAKRISKTLARTAVAALVGIGVFASSGLTAHAVQFFGTHTHSIDPNHGPAGTRVFVKSDVGCERPEAASNWQVTVWVERDGRVLAHTIVAPDAGHDWHWTASVTVPTSTEVGVVHIGANCWGAGADGKNVLYQDVDFKVEPPSTPAPEPKREPEPKPAPKPQPKPARPTFTG